MKPYQASIKRLFDLTFALIGIILLFPFGIVIGVLVKISSPGPALFRQTRIGQWGRPFTCFKFRTMKSGLDHKGSITAAHDPRITPLGAVLRTTKLDELPQLWNVLIGKMSFVGPRPDVAGYADCLSGDDRKILALKPGITGPATIYFRHEELILQKVDNIKTCNDTVIWPKKIAINKSYLDSWSFCKDLGFILITIVPPLNRFLKLVPQSPESLDMM